mmetsp:Transcript_19644/g.40742  ORF Transcript_19644/g.40742 Transcript_19644/m.40742 type:complete len:121 (-) Transcript_19644:255-617(-)
MASLAGMLVCIWLADSGDGSGCTLDLDLYLIAFSSHCLGRLPGIDSGGRVTSVLIADTASRSPTCEIHRPRRHHGIRRLRGRPEPLSRPQDRTAAAEDVAAANGSSGQCHCRLFLCNCRT